MNKLSSKSSIDLKAPKLNSVKDEIHYLCHSRCSIKINWLSRLSIEWTFKLCIHPKKKKFQRKFFWVKK